MDYFIPHLFSRNLLSIRHAGLKHGNKRRARSHSNVLSFFFFFFFQPGLDTQHRRGQIDGVQVECLSYGTEKGSGCQEPRRYRVLGQEKQGHFIRVRIFGRRTFMVISVKHEKQAHYLTCYLSLFSSSRSQKAE